MRIDGRDNIRAVGGSRPYLHTLVTRAREDKRLGTLDG